MSELSDRASRARARMTNRLEKENHFHLTSSTLEKTVKALRSALESRRRIVKMKHDDLASLLGHVEALEEFWR